MARKRNKAVMHREKVKAFVLQSKKPKHKVKRYRLKTTDYDHCTNYQIAGVFKHDQLKVTKDGIISATSSVTKVMVKDKRYKVYGNK